jgi:hypothetical protein
VFYRTRRFINTFTNAHNGSLFCGSLFQPNTSSPIFPIYVMMFHVTILCMFPYLIPVGNSPLHHTCDTLCTSRSSSYGHPKYIWCNVRCSLVISCIWDDNNTIWAEKDTNTDIESRYWIHVFLECVKYCGVYLLLLLLLLELLLLLLLLLIAVIEFLTRRPYSLHL